ncbi:MAG: collagen-like protein [Aristaeellaceae bacterium]
MEHSIQIAIRGKVARQTDKTVYICGNSDFTCVFDFDEEWDAYDAKTARFCYGESYTDMVFRGNVCPVPVMRGVWSFEVGVYAGDLHTTTPAVVSAKKSILCADGVPKEPEPDVYGKIMEQINAGMLKGDPGYTPVKGVDYFDGEPGKKGDPGEPGVPGKDGTDATVTEESIEKALGYKPADEADMPSKLTEPATGLAVGKYFRIAALDENGHAVLEAVDAPVGGLSTDPSLWPVWTADEQSAARERIGAISDTPLSVVADIKIEEAVNMITAQLDKPCRFVSAEFVIPPEETGVSRNVYFLENGKTKVTEAFVRSDSVSTSSTLSAYYQTSAIIIGGKLLSFGCIASGSTTNQDYQARTMRNVMNGYCRIDADTIDIISVLTYGTIFPAGSRLIVYGG